MMGNAMQRGPFRRVLIVICLWGVAVAIAPLCRADDKFTDDQMKAAAVEQANEYGDALLHGDYDSLALKTSQNVLDLMGGSAAMALAIENDKGQMSAQGVSMSSITIDSVAQSKQSGLNIVAELSEKVAYSTPKGNATRKGYLLGLSDDGGHTWKFIDGQDIDKFGDKIRSTIPAFAKDLKLPANAEMTLDPVPPPTPRVVNAIATQAPAAAASDDSYADMETVDRRTYSFKAPTGCNFPQSNPWGISYDYLTLVELPNKEIFGVGVLAERQELDELRQRALAKFRSDITNETDTDTDIFNSRGGRGSIIEGDHAGVRICMITGEFTSDKDGYVILGACPKAQEDEYLLTFRRMLDSIQIKQN
jgi:hypothetical protein